MTGGVNILLFCFVFWSSRLGLETAACGFIACSRRLDSGTGS